MLDNFVPQDISSWHASLDDMFARIAGMFGRAEPRRCAWAYVTGLLAPVERKNSWQLSEAAGAVSDDTIPLDLTDPPQPGAEPIPCGLIAHGCGFVREPGMRTVSRAPATAPNTVTVGAEQDTSSHGGAR
jgi:hypothetical protein